MRISSNFDSGAIEVVSVDRADDIRLRLRADQGIEGDGAFRQWFHFRVHGGAGAALRMVFENASEAAYPDGWPGYRCVASYDRRNWFRVSGTHYVDGQLVVEHTPERDSVYYAYFEPYSHERHLDLLGWAEMSPYASVSNLGATVDGRDLDVVTVGRPGPGKQPVWITARQHPGESMAEWFVEGV
ncbi:M14-type cytosolic carboxypeptidase, partial [Zoogloea sp.]